MAPDVPARYHAGMSQRPKNVIILHSDEMRADCTGFGGSPDARTPHLDAFASQATVMERHFTVHGKCVPSRIAMVTGRHAHSDGLRTVMEPDLLPQDQPDLMKTLRAQGYETAVFGHNHAYAGFYGIDNVKGTGAVDFHSFTKGIYDAFNERRWRLPDAPPGGRVPPQLNDGYDHIGRRTGEFGGFCDDNKTEQALDYLTARRDRSRPFFMQLNIGAPHPAYQVEEPWYSMFDPQRITPFPTALPRNATLPFRAMRRHRTGEGDIPEAAVREVLATYLGMIAKVDQHMGRVLEAVRSQGLWEDTIIVFTSDHGDFAGQYGLCEKFDTVMSDCLMRVPFILHAPGLQPGRRVDALTCHIDLPATVLELLGVQPDARWNMHGASMLPVIAGQHRPVAVFGDGGHEAPMRRRFNAKLIDAKGHKATAGKQHTYYHEPESMARTCMVRTETHKLVMRETGEHELYDLRADPFELDNRYAEPALARLQAELMEQLVRWNLRTMNDRPYHEKVGA
jgi:choline-sulfatase